MEETKNKIRRAQQGDKKIREELVEENLGLVRHVVKRFAGRNLEGEDLFQIGVIGLMQAIDRFDLSMNVKFSTYAVPMIMGEIKRFLRDDGLIKVSRTIRENSVKIARARVELTKRLQREPRLEELATECGLTKEETLLALEADENYESLDAGREMEDGSQLSLGERITANASGGFSVGVSSSADPEKDKLLDRLLLYQMWEGLSKEERRIIWMRFFRDKTQTQVSKELGISQVQVSRKEKKILEKMKQTIIS